MTDDRDMEVFRCEAGPPELPADPDRAAFRRALSRYPTGITVVTARGRDGEPVGITVNSFASLSLHPPLLLWCLGEDSASAPHFLAAERFAVNVLAADQEALARRFASSQAQQARESGFTDGRSGLPLIPGALSVFECSREAVHRGGDHHILIGRVLCFATRPGPPLVFHEGGFRGL